MYVEMSIQTHQLVLLFVHTASGYLQSFGPDQQPPFLWPPSTPKSSHFKHSSCLGNKATWQIICIYNSSFHLCRKSFLRRKLDPVILFYGCYALLPPVESWLAHGSKFQPAWRMMRMKHRKDPLQSAKVRMSQWRNIKWSFILRKLLSVIPSLLVSVLFTEPQFHRWNPSVHCRLELSTRPSSFSFPFQRCWRFRAEQVLHPTCLPQRQRPMSFFWISLLSTIQSWSSGTALCGLSAVLEVVSAPHWFSWSLSPGLSFHLHLSLFFHHFTSCHLQFKKWKLPKNPLLPHGPCHASTPHN